MTALSLITLLALCADSSTASQTDWRQEADLLQELMLQQQPTTQACAAFKSTMQLPEDGWAGGEPAPLPIGAAKRLTTVMATYPGKPLADQTSRRWLLETKASEMLQRPVVDAMGGCGVFDYLAGAQYLVATVKANPQERRLRDQVVRTLELNALREALNPMVTVDLLVHATALNLLADANLLGDAQPWHALKASGEAGLQEIRNAQHQHANSPHAEILALESTRQQMVALLMQGKPWTSQME